MKHETIKEDLAAEAVKIVTGARRSAYGKPENNFERIARLWNAHIANTNRALAFRSPEGFHITDGADLTPTDVATFCRFTKEARLAETPNHRDSFVDIIGYTLCQGEIALDASVAEFADVMSNIPPSQDQAARERDAAASLLKGLRDRTDANDKSWADAANADRREAMLEGGPSAIDTRPAYMRARFGDTIRYGWGKLTGLATVTAIDSTPNTSKRVAADIGERHRYWLENAEVIDVVETFDQKLSAVGGVTPGVTKGFAPFRPDTITEIPKP